ncbi:hypothetical protein [Mesorhizobium sp. M0802]|uniref:ATP-binding protein n=1 Tax=Mesorhizobium sp. M0802 TaxID=2957001 RepID=UPI003337F5CF
MTVVSYELEPELSKDARVVAGDPAARARDTLLLGELAESGRRRRLYVDISGEQVVAIFGKRGTGKSFTLGVVLEGLAAAKGETALSTKVTPRAALVLDIMDIFWTSTIALAPTGPPELVKQHAIMKQAGYTPIDLSVDLWIPAGFENPSTDPAGVGSLVISASDMGLDDWGALFGIDIYTEPRGMLIHELIHSVSITGYADASGTTHPPKSDYSISDLLACCENNNTLLANFQDGTARSVRQRLLTFSVLPLFQGTSTPLSAILRPFRTSVLMLARVPDGLKNVVVAVLTRRIMRERRDASHAQKRLDLQANLSVEEKNKLQNVVNGSIPRTWVLMDEAHVLASSDAPPAVRESLIKFAKEGRNYGLSLCIATQQPSAIDPKLMSQVETLLVHQLTAPRDAQIAQEMIRSPLPSSLKINGEPASVSALIRQLSPGTAIFSSGNAPNLPRCCVVKVRPRVTAHGGYEA